MKKVSIILPVYNVEKQILACLQSIQAQTYKHFEVICIDDGSTDASGIILERFCLADERFMCIHQQNAGVSITRNRALSIASGEYITFIDSDDVVDSAYLEVLIKGIEDHDCDISVCGHDIVYPKFSLHVFKRNNTILSQKEALKEILLDRSIKNYAWGKCYKKECWEGITFPENEIYEDTSTIFRTFFHAKKVYVSNQRLYHYIIRQGSLTQLFDPKMRKELKVAYHRQMNAIGEVYPELKRWGLKNLVIADTLIAFDTIKSKLK